MKSNISLFLITLLVALVSCDKENNDSVNSEKEFDLTGKAQKGPFINGTDIFIYELDNSYKPTGRTFHTNTDEKGNFELKGISLSSGNVELLADGFYYNEVTGSISNEKLSLKAIVDLSEQKSININVLTNLEFDRVKFLIQNQNISLNEAKIQAQKELLKVFEIDSVVINNSENLDIIKSGEGDAVLLAVSAIIQSNRTTSELSKLQADIVLDMKTDGILNDSLIKKSLVNFASVLNVSKVRQNLISKYKELGIIIDSINNFDKHIINFLGNTTTSVDSPFEFPESTSIGKNLLVQSVKDISPNTNFAFAIKMPGSGKVMIKMKRKSSTGYWWYQPSLVFGWKVSNFDLSKNEQTFTSILNSDIIDLPISFTEVGVAEMEYYYNESSVPSYTKTINWGSFNNGEYQFKDESPAGRNLLAMNDSSSVISDSSYVIGIYHDGNYDVNFKLHLPENISVEVMGGSGDYSYDQRTNELEFNLKGKSSISEILLKFNGSGIMELESNLQFKNSLILRRTFYLN